MSRRPRRSRKTVSYAYDIDEDIVRELVDLIRKKTLGTLTDDDVDRLDDLSFYTTEFEKAESIVKGSVEKEEDSDWDYSSSEDEEEDDYEKDPDVQQYLRSNNNNKELLNTFRNEILEVQKILLEKAPESVKHWIRLLISSGISNQKIKLYDPNWKITYRLMRVLFPEKYDLIEYPGLTTMVKDLAFVAVPRHLMVLRKLPSDSYVLYDSNGSGTGYIEWLQDTFNNINIAEFYPHTTESRDTLSDNIFLKQNGRCASWSIFVMMMLSTDTSKETLDYINFVGTKGNISRVLSTLIMGFWVRLQRWKDPLRHTSMQKYLMPKINGLKTEFNKLKGYRCEMQKGLAPYAGVSATNTKVDMKKNYTNEEVYYQITFGLRKKGGSNPLTIRKWVQSMDKIFEHGGNITISQRRAKHARLKIHFPRHQNFMPFVPYDFPDIDRDKEITLSVNIVYELLDDDLPSWRNVFEHVQKLIENDWETKWKHLKNVNMRKIFNLNEKGARKDLITYGNDTFETPYDEVEMDKYFTREFCLFVNLGEWSYPIILSDDFLFNKNQPEGGIKNPTLHLHFKTLYYTSSIRGDRISYVSDRDDEWYNMLDCDIIIDVPRLDEFVNVKAPAQLMSSLGVSRSTSKFSLLRDLLSALSYAKFLNYIRNPRYRWRHSIRVRSAKNKNVFLKIFRRDDSTVVLQIQGEVSEESPPTKRRRLEVIESIKNLKF
tara:strand:- start:42 stop:2183 length:2142 start_codon:yes stop_codon:yes gene_type:complete